MPVQSVKVAFVFSGGNENTNPNLSLGGQPSVVAVGRDITSNVLHNLFDEVQISEALTGEFEVRHFYFRNRFDFELRNARLIVLADNTSIWSKIEFAKGTANNGNVEQAVPNENTLPAGISESSWKIPNAASPLVLGDVAAGSVASVWCRRKVEPQALIARGEKVTIRIIADPPVPIAPPINCPEGEHYNPVTQQCEEDEDPEEPGSGSPCPEGTHLENGQCVEDGQPPPPQPIEIVVAGDISCNSEGERTIRMAGEMVFNNLFIANGDLSYTSTRDCFTDMIEDYPSSFGSSLRNRTKISIGNHDDDEEQSASLRNSYISYFGIPSNGYYSFNIQNIHVLIMDTQSNYSSGSPQHTFARNDLQTASQTAAIDWIIVCYHKPSITIESDHEALTDFRDIYHPLFDQFKVDLVIAGHNHNMQRTYPIRHNASNPSSPTIVNNTAGPYTNVDGRIFIVIGSGGRALDDLGSMPSHFIFGNDEDHGILDLSFENNNKTLDARFLSNADDEAGIDDLHIFEINKTN